MQPRSDIFNTKTGKYEAFTGFPCGTIPFKLDPNDTEPFDAPHEVLQCEYNTQFDEYECVSGETKATEIVPNVLEAFQYTATDGTDVGAYQPCTADGYVLSGNVRTWWWLCVKEEV